ncbi:hypothetical protein ACFVHB_25760 [Kitasatospora sp. NPDC127111]|uniref:hypothetical protein n=1 Tax=Kitasatospora sp. NPDC127111 TaxID=3345363 RepID=UPI00363C4066
MAVRPPGAGDAQAVRRPERRGSRAPRDGTLTAVCAVLGLLPVAPLLAWAYGLGPFAVWFWAVTVPSLAVLAVIGVATGRSARHHRLHTALVAGTVGGLLGTFAYDLFRLPFLLPGYRLFAPIDSYGVLLLGADSSSSWTGLCGWLFHFGNGIGFGIAYGVVARGRRWYWALAWGVAIETMVVATPVAGVYALRGTGLLAIAYGGHLAYAVPLGVLVADPERTSRRLRELGTHSTAYALLGVLVALVVWQRPYPTPGPVRAGEQVAPGPSAVVVNGRFSPQWLRVPPNGCVSLRDDDAATYALSWAGTPQGPRLEPGDTTRVCFADPGVVRVRTSALPYSGGFVIVDRAEG